MKIVERFDPKDVLTISSGFLAKYVGSTLYDDISQFQDDFYLWVKGEYEKGKTFEVLGDALQAFLALQEEVDKTEEVFVIQKETTIELSNKDIILEEGDKIRVLNERWETPILPFGAVNLVTGENKTIDNVYNTWLGSSSGTICEFWQPTDSASAKIRLVFGSGEKPYNNIGEDKSFIHDQTGRYLFNGRLVDYCVLKDLPSKVSKFGRSLNGYVYK